MEYIVPPVNLSGVFKLKAPLETLLNPNVVYKVIKISNIPSLVDDGIDVQQFIYLDRSLTSDDYINALTNSVPIVTLSTEGDEVIEVPADYINYMPQITGNIFINKAFIVNVGYIPSELDISFIEAELSDIVKSLLGVDVVVTTEEISGKYVVSNTEYTAYERDRAAKISNNNTCRGNLAKALTLITSYKEKMKALIAKVENI